MATKTFVKNAELENLATEIGLALGLDGRCVRRAVEKHSKRLIKETDRVFQFTSNVGTRTQTLYNAREVAEQIKAEISETKECLTKPLGLKTTKGTYKAILLNDFEFEGNAK